MDIGKNSLTYTYIIVEAIPGLILPTYSSISSQHLLTSYVFRGRTQPHGKYYFGLSLDCEVVMEEIAAVLCKSYLILSNCTITTHLKPFPIIFHVINTCRVMALVCYICFDICFDIFLDLGLISEPISEKREKTSS